MRLHAMGAHLADLPLRAYHYAIADIDRLAIRPAGGTVPHPRTHGDIDKATRGCAVHRGAPRRDNRLELFLRTVRTGRS